MIPNAENPKAIAMIQKELRAAMKEWDTLYQKHITEYRRSFQLQMIQYAKVRAINSDLVAGKDPLKTSLMTTATIREARKPVTRKQKKDKQPTERKRKK